MEAVAVVRLVMYGLQENLVDGGSLGFRSLVVVDVVGVRVGLMTHHVEVS